MKRYIKLYEEFDHSDIDPYEEENWNTFGLSEYWEILKTMSLVDLRMITGESREYIEFKISTSGGNYRFFLTDFYQGMVQIYCDTNDKVDQLKEFTKEELIDKISKLSGEFID